MNYLKKAISAILFLVAFIATLQVWNTFQTARAVKTIEEPEPVTTEYVPQVEPATVPETTVPEETEVETTVPETIEETVPSIPTIDCSLDEATQEMIYQKCVEYDVDFAFTMALIFKESSFRPDVVSQGGDYGLMQINKINHKWLSEKLGITNFLDPEQNVTAGLYILHQLFEKYDNPRLVLMSYNMGEGGASKLWKQGIYSTDYAEGILQLADKYSKEIEERMGENV